MHFIQLALDMVLQIGTCVFAFEGLKDYQLLAVSADLLDYGLQ